VSENQDRGEGRPDEQEDRKPEGDRDIPADRHAGDCPQECARNGRYDRHADRGDDPAKNASAEDEAITKAMTPKASARTMTAVAIGRPRPPLDARPGAM